MLARVLRALDDPKPVPLAELAARLDTDIAALQRAMDQCRQLGYLERTEMSCDMSSCGSCPVVSSGCHPSPSRSSGAAPVPGPSWWRITDRGRRAIGVAARHVELVTLPAATCCGGRAEP